MTPKQKAQRLQALKDAYKRLKKKEEPDDSEFEDERGFEETKVNEMYDEIGEENGY